MFVFIASPAMAVADQPYGYKTVTKTITDSFKKGVFDNKVTVKDNLNDNLNDNQLGLMNQKGHHNSQVSAVSIGGEEGGSATGGARPNQQLNHFRLLQ